jgi:integrase
MPTFGAWVEECLKSVARKPGSGRALHRALLGKALLVWQGRPLDRILRSNCEELLAGMLRDDEAFATIYLRCVTVRRIFRRACRAGLIATNPWRGVELPRPVRRGRVVTRREEDELRCCLGQHWARLVRVGVGTGLRPAELLKITPAHRVGHTLELTADITSDGHPRTIPLRDHVVRALDEQAAVSRSTTYWACKEGLANDVLHSAAVCLGWPELTLRDLRRTFGTRSAEAGMPIAQLQAIMGQSSARTTAIYYAHLKDPA